jgi:GntR family phosphonate transport system transcriptional regulator
MDMSRQVAPRYLELADALRDELDSYVPGDYLPSELQLAQRFSVNRHTLRRAVDVLVAEGRVLRHQGRRTCVLPAPIVYPVHAGSTYSKTLAAMGFRSDAVLLNRRQRPAKADEANQLALDEQDLVEEITTLRLLNEQPISLIVHCFSARRSGVLEAYKGGSLRLHLEQQAIALKRASTLIGARAPSQKEALQLLMPRHTPVLSIRTLSCDADGQPFELSNSISRADRFKYHVISGDQHE